LPTSVEPVKVSLRTIGASSPAEHGDNQM